MSELVARTGRQQQRYEDGCRLIAGCIPFKYRSPSKRSDGASKNILEVLMISSASGRGLVFPKGGWENDETVEEAAVREAAEEAGVRGELLSFFQEFLGYYEFKSKTLQDECCPEGLCKAAMFALLVKEELQVWPEQSTRKRIWLTIPEAVHSCRDQWMRSALKEGFVRWHEDQGMSSTKEDENRVILTDSSLHES
ncbi:nudix hydrolase 16, mitochondrial-like isoform X1 [Prosopis cineraria]|uniref:nudix hydrolase 16, mitochondrial-like isoform X1 n=1 Tax=Prosopis cineraria TaxID=364024 RepID=UPI00240F9C14|nr:nudix hydrolase 16, mitochondrial-like isoform X1 [Prosopis cineraria]